VLSRVENNTNCVSTGLLDADAAVHQPLLPVWIRPGPGHLENQEQ